MEGEAGDVEEEEHAQLQQEVAELEGEGPTDSAEVIVGGVNQEEDEGSDDELEEDRRCVCVCFSTARPHSHCVKSDTNFNNPFCLILQGTSGCF